MGSGYSWAHVAADDCYNTYVIQGVTFNQYGASCAT